MRYYKIGADGARLPDDATDFVATEDTVTGLMWSATLAEDVKQAELERIATACVAAGFADWRPPTVDELATLPDRTRDEPAIDTKYFPDTRPDWYWSSSAYAGDPVDSAWVVHFRYGSVLWYDRHYHACVRAVRSVASPVAGQ